MIPIVRLGLLLGCLHAFALGQDLPTPTAGTAPRPTAPSFDLGTATGIDRDEEGRWIGMAHGYLARFEADGIDYVPALGHAAPRDMPWRFRLASVGRGDSATKAAPGELLRRGDALHYERPGMTERYTVLATGVKQDFVFHSLPAGRGDLVVQGRVTTELQPGPVGESGQRFLLPGVGGVEVGAVVGIDATGRRVQGTSRWHEGYIEYALPASFVDSAVLPLTIDPLLGTYLTTVQANSANDNLDAAPLTNASGLTWCVVWEQVLSATNSDIRILRILNGSFFGTMRAIEASSTVDSYGPRIATLAGMSSWIVVYGAAQTVYAVTYVSADVVNTTAVVTTAGTRPTVGGDSRASGGNTATIGWIDTGVAGVRLCSALQISPYATLGLGPTVNVTAGSSGSGTVDISRTGGASGNWLVVYPRVVPPGITRMYCRVWDGTAFVTSEGASLAATAVAAVDGDGANWVVAYQVAEVPANGLFDIHARAVRRVGATTTSGVAAPVSALQGFDETGPAVAWAGSSALVAYTTALTATLRAASLASVDTIACATCENIAFLDSSGTDYRPRVASSSPNGQFGGVALAVWSGGTTGGARAQAYQATDGDFTPLGGGCGAGGDAIGTCAHSPNANFQLRLQGATASTATFAIVGDDTFGFACGPCDFVVDPFASIVLAATTSSLGAAELPVPIPSAAAGRRFRVQWATLGASCVNAVDLSNGVRIQIE